jgi:hypothetical protein
LVDLSSFRPKNHIAHTVCVGARISIVTTTMESLRNKLSQLRRYHCSFPNRAATIYLGMAMFLARFCLIIDDMAMRSSWLRLLNGSFDTKDNLLLTMEHSLHQPTPYHHPDNKIIVYVALPRCGTTSFISFMKALFPDEPKEKFIHQYNNFSAFNLAEFLTLGNLSSPENPVLRLLIDDSSSHRASKGGSKTANKPEGNTTSLLVAMADYPAFLLAPRAMEFPDVYWVQVTRDVEDLVDSTLYMIQRWMKNRCNCPQSPSCYKSDRFEIMDRLYYNRYKILEDFCNNHRNASAIPRKKVRQLVTTFEGQIANYLKNHPHYLHFTLEEDTDVKLQKLATFLGLETVPSANATNIEFQANKRIFQVPSP